MTLNFSRKHFLAVFISSIGVFLSAIFWKERKSKMITGRIIGPDKDLGHKIRTGSFSKTPSVQKHIGTLILGGGIAGLSSAYYLSRSGYSRFLVLELESVPGGNSRSGQNEITRYPWGSHYLPTPSSDATLLNGFLKDIGVIIGYDTHGNPLFDEKYQCFDPEERLYVHGRWQEGLFPKLGATSQVLKEKEKFDSVMNVWRNKHGNDGKKAFTIPLDFSSRDESIRKLDQITFLEYLKSLNFTTKEIFWFAEYATRDDYGSSLKNTSAWAGIHYFASRPVDKSGEDLPVLTWPEGNGFLVNKLKSKFEDSIRTGELVFRLRKEKGKLVVSSFCKSENSVKDYIADSVIYALPQFTRKYIFEPLPAHEEFIYSPWVVANLTVDKLPEGKGASLAWDNVFYNSPSLGYINAMHQKLQMHVSDAVLTYYLPFSGDDTKSTRKDIEKYDWEKWKTIILQDFKRTHRNIESTVRNIDIIVHAHAMIRPVPGFIWGKARLEAGKSIGNIHFAHSDLSGISIFEEAHYRGYLAANKILGSMGKS